jgi:hypothetical protein
MQGETTRKNSYGTALVLSVFMICATILVAIYMLSYLPKNDSSLQNTSFATTTITSSSTVLKDFSTTTKEKEEVVTLYDGISDAGFVQFAKEIIDVRCPFYVPDGATYRDCLSSWVAKMEQASLVEQVDEVHAYCEMFSKKFASQISFEMGELFSKCVLYRLSS